jgi:hypothetical protein
MGPVRTNMAAGICLQTWGNATGIAADTWTVDETIKSRPDCIARTWPAYTTQEACEALQHEAHFWANTWPTMAPIQTEIFDEPSM